jgi:hypothetical protein
MDVQSLPRCSSSCHVTEFWTCRCFIARVALVIVGDHC